MLRSALIWFFLLASAQAGESLALSASANLFFALDQLNVAFHAQEPGVELKLTLDKSDKLVTQILRGSPCDVFLCADIDHPRDLVRAGLADGDSLTVFAVGRLVIWTARADLELSTLASVARNPQVKQLALTNAETGPYARAARQALIRSGAWLDALPKVTVAESIMEVARLVQAGEADAGFISLSLALSPKFREIGHWREIALDPSTPLTQGAVLTKHGRKNRAAQRYLAFLRTPVAKKILQDCGYAEPELAGRIGEP
ncbi:MAG: molybdate ABC transporter substrate-binding protein [Opitutaceae bacterium]|nr:molybdate ABC transporter substrate-binding protein [Opitutaceae bacterium]MBP9911850.1 molybdate ABC transporter substrate-binding protein [Opitutaceae bacterium]